MQPHPLPAFHFACLLFAGCLSASGGDTDGGNTSGGQSSTGSESSTGSTTDTPDTEPTTASAPCGDGVCGPDEDPNSCPADCPVSSPVCGDGVKGPGESCDDGPENSDDYAANAHCNSDCSALAPYCGDDTCQTADGESANTCAKDCTAMCGNGVVEPGEDCDEVGGGDSATCDADCTTVMCGDSHPNAAAGEDCDDGNLVDTDACIACKSATCGDGILLAGVEECDDENDKNDDACSNGCQKPRRIFVTSVSYKGNLGGLSGADEKCQMLADAATPKVEGTFIAWLSDATDSPSTRLDTSFTGAYKAVNGAVIASNGWADLTDGTLNGPIKYNENKDLAADESVWTNTAPDGTAADVEKHCGNWTSAANDIVNKVAYGYNMGTAAEWTQNDVSNCHTNLRLYCFESP